MDDDGRHVGCEFLRDCHFFSVFGHEREHHCYRFTHVYCQGPLSERCEKRRFRLNHGRPPGVGMGPTGEVFVTFPFTDCL